MGVYLKDIFATQEILVLMVVLSAHLARGIVQWLTNPTAKVMDTIIIYNTTHKTIAPQGHNRAFLCFNKTSLC